MTILVAGTALFALWLIAERIRHERHLRSIPLRIAVTGTRGKSSVVRLLAAVLREDGRSVIAKTTGSRAVVILPDGTEEEMSRRGVPSIIEQLRAVRRAAGLSVDTLVMETMSIHQENHRVEGEMLVRPHLVAVTNTWPDHVEAMGATESEVAEVLADGIPDDAMVFIPAVEDHEVFHKGGGCMVVERGAAEGLPLIGEGAGPALYEEHFDLVKSVSHHLGIDDATIRKGVLAAETDVGALACWRYHPEGMEHGCFLVSGFAANDPRSTEQALGRALDRLPTGHDQVIGLLNLRLDRGDRTVQWLEALRGGWLKRFRTLYVTGGHARALARRLPGVRVLTMTDPEEMTGVITSDVIDHEIIFGFGNFHGMGELLTEHWMEKGTPDGI